MGTKKTKKSGTKAVAIVNSSKEQKLKWMLWMIGIVAFFSYANTFKHGFVLDDIAVIEQNESVKQGFGGITKILTEFYWKGFWDQNSGIYRPFSLVMFAIEYALSPNNPSIHHFVNVLLYAISCMLLFRVLRLCFKEVSPWVFFIAVLIFVLHPAHTEVVANIKSRDEILALFFFLLCCYFLYRKPKRHPKDLVLGTIAFLCALFSKEGVIALLPLLFILEYMYDPRLLNSIKKLIPILSVSILWFLWHQHVVGKDPAVHYSYQDNSLLESSNFVEQKATALGLFMSYELKAFYPYQLSYDYSYPQVPIISFSNPKALLGLLFIVATFFSFVYFFIKRRFLLCFAVGLILLPLLLTGNLFMTIGATMADRFLYIPSLGASLLIAIGVDGVFRKNQESNVVDGRFLVSTVPLILLFMAQTFQRNPDWKSNASLFAKDVQNAPNSARTHYNFSTVLMSESADNPEHPSFQTAFDELTIALKLDEGYCEAYINKGKLLMTKKDYPAARDNFLRGIEKIGNDPDLLGGAGESLYYLNKKDSAAIYLEQALDAGNNMAGIYLISGTIEFEHGAYIKASKIFEKGLKKDPNNVNLLTNYGNSLAAQQKFEAALEQFSKVQMLEPNNAQNVYFMAMAYEQIGQVEKAKSYLDAWKKMTGN